MMKIKVYLINDSHIKEITTNKHNAISILNDELSEIDASKIDKIEVRERYVYSNTELDNLRKKIVDYGECSSASISIENATSHSFDIIIEGKILDVFSLIYYLRINHEFSKLSSYLENDYYILDTLLNGVKSKGDVNMSLVLKFLSSHNGNDPPSIVYEILKNDLNKKALKQFLPNMFKNIYGISHSEFKLEEDIDKLTLRNLDIKKFNDLGEELKILVGES